MRPVNKWQIGHNGVVPKYEPHTGAKPKLLENFGNEPFYFCNYCDRLIPQVNIEVEHIQCVHHYPDLEYYWTNFLASCKNCNLTKGDTDFAPGNVLLPHVQNTWDCFLINNDGTMAADASNAAAYQRALRTVEIWGLDRGFSHPHRQPQDDRYHVRRHVLILANRALKHYEDGVPNYLPEIIDQAIALGFWYVWMKVFANHPQVQDELIAAFNNTYINCRTTNVDRI
jgi:hypothetical protein